MLGLPFSEVNIHDISFTKKGRGAVTVFPQRLFLLVALVIADLHIHHHTHELDLQFPQFHPLQLRETHPKPPIFKFFSICFLRLGLVLIVLAVAAKLSPSPFPALPNPCPGLVPDLVVRGLELSNLSDEVAFVVL
jgi:hypothetical protein